jgi:hypothetical protein
MKSKLISIIFTAALLSLAQLGFAQGFVNLGFESATLVPVPGDPYGSVQFAQAFPGWAGTAGGIPLSGALTNNVFLNQAGISIIDHNWTNSAGYKNGGGYPPIGELIQGHYTAILYSGLVGFQTAGDTTLSQTGLVPAGTASLQFRAFEGFDPLGSFAVTLGGQNLSLVTISNSLNYTLYGADISAWAGQTAQLAFTVFAESPYQVNEYLYLDAIQFSTQSIPEPGAFVLAALGTLFLGFSRRRQ